MATFEAMTSRDAGRGRILSFIFKNETIRSLPMTEAYHAIARRGIVDGLQGMVEESGEPNLSSLAYALQSAPSARMSSISSRTAPSPPR
jgi:hypothetical protein